MGNVSSVLITMVSAGMITAVSEEICNAMGKGDIARWIKVGGISLCISLALGLAIKAINQAKMAFGG